MSRWFVVTFIVVMVSVVALGGSARATTISLDFNAPVPGTILDQNGNGTGLLDRLPGTGSEISGNDPNLHLNVGSLDVTSVPNADFNGATNLTTTSTPGIKLSSLGFTGTEDFSVSATGNLPVLSSGGYQQVGVYVGTASDKFVRAGIIHIGGANAFAVNNNGGADSGTWSERSPFNPTIIRLGKMVATIRTPTRATTMTLFALRVRITLPTKTSRGHLRR